jgi:hypothetical protein
MPALKQPRRIRQLYQQILQHPDYKMKLSGGTRFAFESGCVSGYSWCEKENNKWSREIWNYLYLGEDPKGQFKEEKLTPKESQDHRNPLVCSLVPDQSQN